MLWRELAETDPALASLLSKERKRQAETIDLIPSENYASPAVLAALGSEFTNKYSEGFPGRRYYGGQECTDAVEAEVIARAKRIFRADHANVQALSGAAANLAVYAAWLDPGDTVLAMELSHGGHLTHGDPRTYVARNYRFVRYGIADHATGALDYDQLARTAESEHPRLIVAGFSSFPRRLDYKRIAAIARQAGAVAMADLSHLAGFIAAGDMENPLDSGFHVMTLTTHKSLRGPRGALILTKGQVSNPLTPVAREIQNLPTLIDRAVFPGIQGGPHMNAILAIGIALQEATTPAFLAYSRLTLANARALAEELRQAGVKLVTGGTDNHLLLIDCVASFDLDGAKAQEILETVNITTNKNVIPDDKLPPYRPSGLRLGTPAVSTRCFTLADMKTVANWIVAAIAESSDPERLAAIRSEVAALCRARPVPGGCPTTGIQH